MFIFSSWFLYIYLIYLRIKVHCFVSFTFLFSRILDSKSHFQSSPSIFFLATLLFPSPLPQTILKIIYKLQLLFMLGEISATTGSKSQICVDILNDFRSAGGRVENVSNEKKNGLHCGLCCAVGDVLKTMGCLNLESTSPCSRKTS